MKLTNWKHSPTHAFVPGGYYIVTSGTYLKRNHFSSESRLGILEETLFQMSDRFGWTVEAWALLSNHYHFIARSPEDARSLKSLVQGLHSITARFVNREDKTPGRKVWFQYWDTCLTNERSYLARLHYVHTNPVKHGIVESAEDYPWCSCAWFLNKADQEIQKKVLSAGCENISIPDDF